MKVLDLGCGSAKKTGAFGVDKVQREGVDLVWDLDRFPYPMENDTYDRIIAEHVVEHLNDVPHFFSEVHRIARPGASIHIVTPHFSNRCAYADPTHRHAFSVRFLDFFCGNEPRRLDLIDKSAQYLLEHRFGVSAADHPPTFKLESREVTFSRIFNLAGIASLANRFVDFWEFYLAFVFPGRDILAELTVRKEDG